MVAREVARAWWHGKWHARSCDLGVTTRVLLDSQPSLAAGVHQGCRQDLIEYLRNIAVSVDTRLDGTSQRLLRLGQSMKVSRFNQSEPRRPSVAILRLILSLRRIFDARWDGGAWSIGMGDKCRSCRLELNTGSSSSHSLLARTR